MKILLSILDFSKIAVLFYPFLSWIYINTMDLYTTYYVVDIPEENDCVIMDTDLLLHRCRDRDKENRVKPR